MRKRLTGEQLFPMVCHNDGMMESLRREAAEKCFEFYEDIGVDGWIDESFLSDNYFNYAKDAKDLLYEQQLRIRADMALLDELTLDNYKKPPFTSFDADDVTYEAGKEYFVYLTRDIAGRYHIRLMPISYYDLMKIVPDYKRQKPYVKEWKEGFKSGRFSADGFMAYRLNLDRWDLVGSIRKDGKTLDQLSFGVAPKAYDAYNATLKYIQESGMLENHTFEEAYDIVVYLTEKACLALERYIEERNLFGRGYRRRRQFYEHPDAFKAVCRKILPDGKKLAPIIFKAYLLNDTLASYRFNDGAIPNGWGGFDIKKMKRFQIRKVREFV